MNNQMKRLTFLAHFGQLKHDSWYLVSVSIPLTTTQVGVQTQ